MRALDLFSAAAGGWSLGLHRAGFRTVAACEAVDWRRALYAENNPGVPIYDDVCTLTGERLYADLGILPELVVGSPPCQDISPANTGGKGVEGARSGLYFEAIRIIGEVRPRWFALENSANLRTRGADAVLAALEGLGYSCWAFVVRAGDVGANHERPRSWLIGCDLEQVADTHGDGRTAEWGRWRRGFDLSDADDPDECFGQSADAAEERRAAWSGDDKGTGSEAHGYEPSHSVASTSTSRNTPDPDQAGQADGCLVPGIRQAQIAHDGRGDVRRDDVVDANGDGQPSLPQHAEMGGGESSGGASSEPWAEWNLGLAGHLRLDDGLSAWVAGARIAVGGPKGTAAAALLVEAFGDAVVPQIPEAIGRAILRVEAALGAVAA
ncbi:DNA cytosine methyltransferase [Sphingomonas sp. R-74633]|uniref:DNA cytosine methyltransferase n=1 Tax=Sphingomonas sp. R-74633 TaxID=2751188 RepID=UPI0015D3BA05|nr:DNA cytosine methyltransferase [Sphingomonas sp. R-74633]NYT42305.1 DNA cytosine methyltransferase [Sphingomonas sp. R-74633]